MCVCVCVCVCVTYSGGNSGNQGKKLKKKKNWSVNILIFHHCRELLLEWESLSESPLMGDCRRRYCSDLLESRRPPAAFYRSSFTQPLPQWLSWHTHRVVIGSKVCIGNLIRSTLAAVGCLAPCVGFPVHRRQANQVSGMSNASQIWTVRQKFMSMTLSLSLSLSLSLFLSPSLSLSLSLFLASCQTNRAHIFFNSFLYSSLFCFFFLFPFFFNRQEAAYCFVCSDLTT